MAFTAVASLATSGFAAASAATILAAVTEIGTALTVVGAVTGSKDLMKVGAVMGLVGGVGGLVNGMAGAATAGAAGSAATDSAGAGLSGMDMAADAGMSSASSGGAAIGGSTGAAVSGMDQAADAGMGSYGGAVSSPVTPNMVQGTNLGSVGSTPASTAADAASTVGSATPNATGITTPADVSSNLAPDAVNTPITGNVAPVTPMGGVSGMDLQADAGMSAYGPGAPIKSGSFFDKFSTFANNNKGLLDTGLKFGLGAIKGAADGQFSQAQIDIARQRLAYGNSVANTNPGIINGRIN